MGIRTWWRSRRRRREALGLPPRRQRRVCRPFLLFLLLLLQMEEDPTSAGLLVDGSRLLGVEMVVALWPTTMTMTTRRVTSCPPCRNSLITTKRRPRPPVGTRTRNRFIPMRRRRRKISRMVLRSLPTFRITLTLTLIFISTTTTTERTPARSVQCCSRLRRLLRPPRGVPDTRLLVRTRTRTRSSPLLTTCPEPFPSLPSLRVLPPPSPCRIMRDDNLPRGSSRPRVESLAGWGWGWGWGFRRRRVGRTRIGRRSMRKGGWRVRSS